MPGVQRKLKPKRCWSCGKEFAPFNSLQRTCATFKCSAKFGEARAAKRAASEAKKAAKIARDRHRADKERVKPTSKLRAEAIQAFNAYIRERDAGLPCITCDRSEAEVERDPPLTGGVWHAGHFQSTGSAPEKRFLEDNVHRQCAACNRPGGHTRERYEARLRERIGDERVEAVLARMPESRYRADDFRRIRDDYRAKRRALKGDRST